MQTVDLGLAERNPGAVLSNVERQERDLYNKMYRPLNRKMLADLDSTKLVDTAKDNADANFEDSQARAKRMQSRYGVQSTGLDRSRNTYDSALAKGVNFDNLVNNSRVEQYERNVNLRDSMLNLGRGIATSATDGLGTASQLQTNRENTNDSINAQNKAAKRQMTGQLVGTAAMVAMMMM